MRKNPPPEEEDSPLSPEDSFASLVAENPVLATRSRDGAFDSASEPPRLATGLWSVSMPGHASLSLTIALNACWSEVSAANRPDAARTCASHARANLAPPGVRRTKTTPVLNTPPRAYDAPSLASVLGLRLSLDTITSAAATDSQDDRFLVRPGSSDLSVDTPSSASRDVSTAISGHCR